MKKKIFLIIIPLIFLIILFFWLFQQKYEIKVNVPESVDKNIPKEPSDDFMELVALSNLQYYKDNHILVAESSEYYTEANGENLDNKYIHKIYYTLDDDGEIIKIASCTDHNNHISYNWYRYKNKEYVQYNNYVGKIYPLYSFAKYIDKDEIKQCVPNLQLFANYNPEFVSRHRDIENESGEEYIEEYKLHFKRDDFFVRELEKYFGDRKEAYLKVAVNDLDLVTSIGISYDMANEYIYGPFRYEYYTDATLDLTYFLEKANQEPKDTIKIDLYNINTKELIDTVEIDKDDPLFIEKGLNVDEVFIDENQQESYTKWLRVKIARDEIDNMIKTDTKLFVKEKER